MDRLQSTKELVGNHQDGLERELALAEIEQILKTGAKSFEDESAKFAFLAIRVDCGYPSTGLQGLVGVCLCA